MSARRLRARDLEAPFYGTRRRVRQTLPAGADDAPLAMDRATRARVLRDARAYATVMAPGAFFSGRTAAVLHGLPVWHGAELEVGVFKPSRAPRGRGVRGRTLTPGLTTIGTLDGLPVMTPAALWVALGAELSERELVHMGDAIVRIPRDDRGVPRPELCLATLDELHAALAPGARRGSRRLRAALSRIRVGSMSPLETDARLNCVDAGLPEPELDVEIRDGTQGRLLGIADGRYARHRVLLEIEGDHHRTDRRQWARDIAKHAAYAAEGYETVRLTGAQIRQHPDAGVALVRDALIRRGWRPGQS